MNGFLAPTDHDWFTFLRGAQPHDEVNFWRPSGQVFKALQPGAPLFFKLKSPHDAIGGFGLFARFELVSASLAWDAFGLRNGATSFDELCRRIERYRGASDPLRNYQLGCIMLSQPVFFDEADWVPQPSDWKRQIVAGAGYDLSVGEGLRIWEACRARAEAMAGRSALLRTGEASPELPRHGAPQLVLPRLGQGTFRIAVAGAYEGACSVTGEHSMPVLEAAHIRPFAERGPHAVPNGLLLRADLHRLFDRGYATVTPDGTFEVSRRLAQEFDNGKVYYDLHGRQLRLPKLEADRPDRELLKWHNENVFEKGRAA